MCLPEPEKETAPKLKVFTENVKLEFSVTTSQRGDNSGLVLAAAREMLDRMYAPTSNGCATMERIEPSCAVVGSGLRYPERKPAA